MRIAVLPLRTINGLAQPMAWTKPVRHYYYHNLTADIIRVYIYRAVWVLTSSRQLMTAFLPLWPMCVVCGFLRAS